MGLVGFDEIDGADLDELYALVEEHHLRTQSPVAARMLRDWATERERFKKVMPHDYKRALRELAEAEEALAEDPTAAVSSEGEGFVTTEAHA
jgi:glutamate synthase domain-containing protein 3